MAAIGKVQLLSPELLEGDLIQPGHSLFGIIWINPQRVSGAPCFYATRVPVQTLFNCIRANQTLEEFLDDFEGVTREQAEAVLRLAEDGLVAQLPRGA
jgi:uncharacterized protein (DUF433 family)